MSAKVPDPDIIAYQKCYCEENVYKLCETLRLSETSKNEGFVIFLTSGSKAFPLWYQKSSTNAETPVFWDYHVLLVLNGRVYDIDSCLSWGISLEEYLALAIRPDFPYSPAAAAAAGMTTYLPANLRTVFRIIPAPHYLACFSSDRRHMKNSPESAPTWELIRGCDAKSAHCLPSYWHVPAELQEVEVEVEPSASSSSSTSSNGSSSAPVVSEDLGGCYGQVVSMTAFAQWCARQQVQDQ